MKKLIQSQLHQPNWKVLTLKGLGVGALALLQAIEPGEPWRMLSMYESLLLISAVAVALYRSDAPEVTP